ncbi:MAG TPA: HAMP domain-containing protein [Streptosporangiaceae bacterium]|nr:HAMP domain-containing protein [Streptosporangiaceae bacterium]
MAGSALLAVVIGAAYFLLALVIADLRETNSRATHALEVLVAANSLQRLLVAVDAAERGFILSGDAMFLESFNRDQAGFIRQAAVLEDLARAGDAGQGGRAHEIRRAGTAYITDYAIPLVATAQRDMNAARSPAATAEGHRLLVAMGVKFDKLTAREQQLFASDHRRADAAATRSLIVSAASVGGSIALILVSGGYLARSVVRPIRRASEMAGRLAGGDLSARVPETGPGEVGVLERSLNTMAGSLETSRKELAASRARLVMAADETRRRIERDLHDGIQQRLISLALALRSAEAAAPGQAELISQTTHGLNDVVDELREISRGLHPAILEQGGLGPALRALARRAGFPVELSVVVGRRLPERAEVTAYYVVSEALTNVAKHASASVAFVDVSVDGGALRVEVRDDGVGGASAALGSGLTGMSDRVQAAGGQIDITSPPGSGTSIVARIPFPPR